jgi:hypothetical protein
MIGTNYKIKIAWMAIQFNDKLAHTRRILFKKGETCLGSDCVIIFYFISSPFLLIIDVGGPPT